jgi:hypothetical protein
MLEPTNKTESEVPVPQSECGREVHVHQVLFGLLHSTECILVQSGIQEAVHQR